MSASTENSPETGPGSGSAPAQTPIQGPLSIAQIYRRSLKPRDLRFNNYACRPLAAVLVYLLRPTKITPNQVTFLSLFVALLADALLALWIAPMGLCMAALCVYLAFVLDCTDGQLARIKGQSSIVGSYLDFMMDEIKAVALIAGVAVHLSRADAALPWAPLAEWAGSWRLFWLGFGLCGVVVATSGLSLTTFMRRPEYFEATTGKKARRVSGFTALEADEPDAAPAPKRSLVGRLVRLPIRILEEAGKLVLHYPAWFYIPALLGHIEWFLIPYVLAHAMYLGRSGLIVLLKLGR